MIAVIAVVNDRAVYDAMLGASLSRQRFRYAAVVMDNGAGGFRSAASAFNVAGRQADGDFLFFAHQDVSFESERWLEDAEALLRSVPDLGIAGVAGARPGPWSGREVVSLIRDSDPPQRLGHVEERAIAPVQTVDECAFFVPRDVFERQRFDERTCDGWHLYAVDYSLSALEAGLQVRALPLPLYHRSGGKTVERLGITTFEHAYFRTLRRVAAKHASHVPTIYTTCGAWRTDRSLTFQRYPPREILRALYRRLRGASA